MTTDQMTATPAPVKSKRGVGIAAGIAVAALIVGGGAGYLIGSGSSDDQCMPAANQLVVDYESMLRLMLQHEDAASRDAFITMDELTAKAREFRSDVTAQLDILNACN